MIIYNTLMGVCAGLILILMAKVLRYTYIKNVKLKTDKTPQLPTYGLLFIALGLPLTFLSAAMTLTWPLEVNPPINIAFGEPSLLLGVFAVVAGVVLHRNQFEVFLSQIQMVIAAVGLVLVAISSAIFSYDLVGDAPSQEPITGQFQGWENTTFGVVYALAALGCLAFWFYRPNIWRVSMIAYHVTRFGWFSSGVFFLLFSILNYRTHIGLLVNLEQGTDYRW